jgi:hypothetical protein
MKRRILFSIGFVILLALAGTGVAIRSADQARSNPVSMRLRFEFPGTQLVLGTEPPRADQLSFDFPASAGALVEGPPLIDMTQFDAVAREWILAVDPSFEYVPHPKASAIYRHGTHAIHELLLRDSGGTEHAALLVAGMVEPDRWRGTIVRIVGLPIRSEFNLRLDATTVEKFFDRLIAAPKMQITVSQQQRETP